MYNQQISIKYNLSPMPHFNLWRLIADIASFEQDTQVGLNR